MAEKPSESGSFWPDWLTPRRAWEFIKNVATLEQSVTELRVENREIRSEIARMQQQLIEQNAQLVLLTTFVRDSVSNRLEAKIERLAAEILADKKNR
jgi:ribosomal protein S3AE